VRTQAPELEQLEQLAPPEQWRTRPTGRRRFAAGIAALWLLSGVYIVSTDQQAVETHFGRVAAARVMPGIHVSWPWPIARVYKLRVRQLQRLTIGGDPSNDVLGRAQPRASQFLTGDQNIIQMRVVAQYSVSTPAAYLFHSQDAAGTAAAAVEAELTREIANRQVDAILTVDKVLIQQRVRETAQRMLDRYGIGIELASVNIEMAAPPPDAAEAFRDVASARADSARIVSEAQGYAGDVVPKARGEARQLLESAAGYRQTKINEAQGDAARFEQVAFEYAKASQVNGERLYAETMEQVLPRIKKLIVDKNGNLDLTIIRKGEGK